MVIVQTGWHLYIIYFATAAHNRDMKNISPVNLPGQIRPAASILNVGNSISTIAGISLPGDEQKSTPMIESALYRIWRTDLHISQAI